MNANQDADYLRLLAIFHYVVAGILALFSLFPVIHLVIGIAIVSGAFPEMEQGEPLPAMMGWFFVVLPLVFIVCGLAIATCVAMAGRRLGRHNNYMFCLVVAGIECIFMPLGTVLGVLTIVLLVKPSVKELFGVA